MATGGAYAQMWARQQARQEDGTADVAPLAVQVAA